MLVSYGSDAESDDERSQTVPKAAPPAPSTSQAKPGSSSLQLPAPKGKKANRGPVKISLTDVSSADAPAPEADEPAKKRPKLGGLGSGGGGLSSLLPAPKKETVKPAAGFSGQPVVPEQTPDEPLGEEETAEVEQPASASMMMPKSVKRKQPTTTQAAPAEDMFGLGSVSASSAAASSSSTSTAPPPSRKAFTAAPTVAEKPKQNYYAALPAASPENPYPGFHCIPQTGQWEPDRPDEWAEWAVMHGWAPTHQQQQQAEASSSSSAAPRGFEGAELGDVSEISSEKQRAEAAASREAAENMPSKAAYVDPKEAEEKRLKLAKLQGAGRARGKNQLSSLLSNAIGQREELEEKIALAKGNKRAGGKKYGF